MFYCKNNISMNTNPATNTITNSAEDPEPVTFIDIDIIDLDDQLEILEIASKRE